MPAEKSQTLDRGLYVLELLASTPEGLTVTEIAATLSMGRTVVYRLVVTLEVGGDEILASAVEAEVGLDGGEDAEGSGAHG